MLKQAVALVKSQLKSDLDLSIAKVSVGQAGLLLIQAQNAVDQAEAELSAALGSHEPHRYTLVDEPQYPLPTASLQELAAQALARRPEIAALRAECAGAERFSAAERDARLPRITALGSAGRTPLGDPAVEGNYAAAGINVEVPIFNGSRLSARYQEALMQERGDRKRLEAEEVQIAEEVNATLLDSRAALKKIGVSRELAASAQEALQLAEARFKLG